VLGESILAATMAVQSALRSGEALGPLTPIIIGGLLIVYSMWWVYFDRPVHDLLTSLRKGIVWGYGHYLVFGAAAAVGAGLAVAVDHVTHHAKVGAVGAGFAVTVPVSVYLLCLWFLHDRPEYGRTRAIGPIVAAIVLLTSFTDYSVLLTGLTLATMVGGKLIYLGR
jgi:low temperature requirement protein LtrA